MCKLFRHNSKAVGAGNVEIVIQNVLDIFKL